LVGCRFDREGVRFEVRDSGPGIPEDQIDSIFEEFSRLPNAAEAGPGAGLGLSIAERISKLLSHKLEVRSTLGKGSIFSLTVPRAEMGTAAALAPVHGMLPKGLKILYVENDASVAQSMRHLLSRWDIEVELANSFGQALALRGNWDVLLADYHLEADGNGLDLIKALKARARAFALITAAPTDELIEACADLDIEVIFKPASSNFIRTFLVRALRPRAVELV
jgi:CheY-like chemotaxis protein